MDASRSIKPDEQPLPTGLRVLGEVHPADAVHLGEEARDLAELGQAGLPIAHGWVVRLGEDPHARLEAAISMALDDAGCARLRPLFPSRATASRFERTMGAIADVRSASEAPARIQDLLDALAAPDLTAALGGSVAALHVRVHACDPSPAGGAGSADPLHGDPDEVSVWSHDSPAGRWRIDRRTMRVTASGEGLQPAEAAEVADLADRAQLALGRPVEIEWGMRRDRFAVVGVRILSLRPSFGYGSWRRVALVTSDEGTVAPLSIDTLDKALSRFEPGSDEPRVRRIYARPYRRMDRASARMRPGAAPPSLARASARAARVGGDVAAPLAAARRFQRQLSERLQQLDAVALDRLDDETLMEALRERQRLAADALTLLDRAREASLAVLTALEAAVGPLPRECFPALAAPKRARSRRRAHERLTRLARRIEEEAGEVVTRPQLPAALQRRWDEAREALADVRPLGIDVRPDAVGGRDEMLLSALRASGRFDDEVERARRDAVRRLLATARLRPFGRAREAIAAPLTVVAARVAHSKGNVAEGLAAALLRLRRAACEAGRRLVETGVLDHEDDALYLHLAEIEEALAGEPGAYAARVRLRREDDQRWARFRAPRRIEGRR